MVLGSGVGARTAYILVHPELWSYPVRWLQFWNGGMVSYGGLGGALLALSLFRRYQKRTQWDFYHRVSPFMLVAWGVGRIGCFLTWHGEEGTRTDVFWALQLDGGTYHPTTLYLSLAFILGGCALAQLDSNKHPRALYSLFYFAIVRGVLDNLRVYHPPVLRYYSQALCSLLLATSIILILRLKKSSRPCR